MKRVHNNYRQTTSLCSFFLLLWIGVFIVAQAGEIDCGPLQNAFGPFDYNEHLYAGPKAPPKNGRSQELYLVESAHLDRYIGLNEKRIFSGRGSIQGNLNYTLRAFPNDHRALYLIIELAERHGGALPKEGWMEDMNWPPTVECYFDRALRWRPRDPVVHQLLGIRKFRRGDFKGALDAFENAHRFGLKSAELDYNMGLTYFKLQDYAKAKELAKSAYANGYPLPGLRNLLIKLGEWP